MDSMAIEKEQGPSWARANWPVTLLDSKNDGLDPTEATVEKVVEGAKAAATASGVTDEAAIHAAAEDSIRAMMLIRSYRVRGHLSARLDPLGLTRGEMPPELTPAFHGFAESDMDRPIWLGGALGFQSASVHQIVAVLEANYCGHVGLEYMHINDLAERRFLQDRMEGKDKTITFTTPTTASPTRPRT